MMSKLQKKAIQMILLMYGLVMLAGLVLSYFVIVCPLREKAVERYKEQHDFVLEEMDTALKGIKEYANYIVYSREVQERLYLYLTDEKDTVNEYELASTLNSMKYVKSGIRSIVLEPDNKEQLYSIILPTKEEQDVLHSEWYLNILEGEYGSGFSQGIISEKNRELAYTKKYNIKNMNFTLTIFFDCSEIFGAVDRYRQSTFEQAVWLWGDKSFLFHQDKSALTEENYKQILDTLSPETEVAKGIFLTKRLTEGSLYSTVYISNSQLYHLFEDFIILLVVFWSLFLLGTLVAFVIIIGRITKPISEVSGMMKAAVEQNLDVELDVRSNDEIGDLSKTFNRMMKEMKGYVQVQVKQKAREQEMRFGLLVSQVDPHFVCNTLNTVNYLAKQKQNEDVSVVSTALANILRDRLRLQDFQIYDTVYQEMQTVEQYLQIQKYRYGDQVQVFWNVPEEVKACKIPKNIIQPLLENSLFHGLSHEDTGEIQGKIWVTLQREDDFLAIKVKDDGRGIQQERIQEILNGAENREKHKKGYGIGIQGITERLRILYGEQFALHIESIPSVSTTIIIKIMYERIE